MRHARPTLFRAVTICLVALCLGAGSAAAATGSHHGESHATPAGNEPEVAPAGVEVAATAPTLDRILHALGVDALAVDMFIKIDGIDGESTARGGHEDWIEIESFSWGESRPSGGTGQGRRKSSATFSDVSVVKGVDAASPNLFQACAAGKHYPSATLVVRKAGEPVDHFSILLQDVMVSSVKLSHSEEREAPMEEITFTYGKITWSYDPQDAKGGKVEAGWDLKANKGV